MAKHRPLRVDPIAEAKRQWSEHGWEDAALGMSAVTSVMRAQQLVLARVEAEMKVFGLSFARFELLRLLAFSREGRMPMASVISRLQVHATSVTSAVDRLSSAGLLRREPHPGDGRSALLALTDAGRELVDRATEALNERVFTQLSISEEDTRELVSILARFRKNSGDFIDPTPLPDPL
ncbi:MarR family winged helix-turn-helix transcriptional regulator [Leucobacter sp. M11]|uniref:MarR family winged helix-turn-helix transcriptional regulator n=1 Tax=Leucobacter sp. M11 TaxID=2993565 RepID=UPI002D7EA50A|nr:MarR family transcriptional regulator [Leucobacter sp. M11]MEB4614970.1 MarR family transcriptional regulator [Leucobacter sp. M11]